MTRIRVIGAALTLSALIYLCLAAPPTTVHPTRCRDAVVGSQGVTPPTTPRSPESPGRRCVSEGFDQPDQGVTSPLPGVRFTYASDLRR